VNFSVLPPEINSAQMFSGAGSAPLLAAAAAWDGLSAELDSAADSFTSVTSGLATGGWQGAASQAMVAAAAPYAGWLSAAAAHASGAATQAQAVATAFEAAQAAVVHPAAVAANRSGLVSLVLSNLFGQNAPAIAAAESQYEEMWAQDVAAMVGYHGGASAAAAQLTTPAQTFQTLAANPAAGFNFGLFNDGVDNVGFFNTGNFNEGLFNGGNYNFGIANSGTLNVGIGNYSLGNIGNFGLFNNGTGNGGIFNTGSYDTGFLNLGDLDSGIANFGSVDAGFANYGNYLFGVGLTGNYKVGFGPLFDIDYNYF